MSTNMSTRAYSESSLGSYQDVDVPNPPTYLTPILETEEIDGKTAKETKKNVKFLTILSVIFGISDCLKQ